MLSNFRGFLQQPLLISESFCAQLKDTVIGATNADIKGLFFNAPCPRMDAERQCSAAKSAGRQDRKAVAVLSVRGVLTQHPSWMMDFIGGTSTDSLSSALDMCLNEDRIGAILFDFHTPGGTPYGIKELADKIHAARSEKLIVSVSNSMMCSAGAWLGAAADRSFVSPMSMNASVGAYSMIVSEAKGLAESGIDVKVIRYPEGKAENHPAEPITDEGVSRETATVRAIAEEFMAGMAKHRGCTVEHVKENFGSGRCLDSKASVSAKLADGVLSFDEVLQRMVAGSVRRQSTGAAAFVEGDGPSMDDWGATERRRFAMQSDSPLI